MGSTKCERCIKRTCFNILELGSYFCFDSLDLLHAPTRSPLGHIIQLFGGMLIQVYILIKAPLLLQHLNLNLDQTFFFLFGSCGTCLQVKFFYFHSKKLILKPRFYLNEKSVSKAFYIEEKTQLVRQISLHTIEAEVL